MTIEQFLLTLKDNSFWVHNSTQKTYRVLGVADRDAKPEWGSHNRVVYVDSDGKMWTRPFSEFVVKFTPEVN